MKSAPATKGQLRQRVAFCLRMRLQGAETWDLLSLVNADGDPFPAGHGTAWNVTPQTLRRYFRLADAAIADQIEAQRDHLIARHTAQRRVLYNRCLTTADHRAALAVLDSEAKLLGLFPGATAAVGGTPDPNAAGTAALVAAAPRQPFGWAWEQKYLSHYLTAEPSRFQLDLVGDLSVLGATRGQRRNYRGPRGSGKTTHQTKGYPLHCICEATEPFILLLAETGPQSKDYLRGIKTELVTNGPLAADYPAACGEGPVWRDDEIVTRHGVRVVARGSAGRVLGLTHRSRRPTLVIGDDLNERADAYSPTKRRRKLDWFEKDVLKVGEPGTNFVVAGTSIHREAITCALSLNAGWESRRYSSVLKWPARMDLWDRWERVLMNLADPDRLAAARAFYDAHKADMDAGADVLWPARFPLYDLMVERAVDGPAAFASERQDEPGNDGSNEWAAAYFDRPDLWFGEWPEHLTFRVQALDPSKGTDARAGDYQAHVRGAVGTRDPYKGVLFLEADLKKQDVTAMVGHAIDTAVAFGSAALVVEENGTMGFIAPEFNRQLAEKQKLLNLLPLTNSEPKLARIRRVGGYLARRQVRVKDTAGGRLLVQQWREFPTADHDDGADAAGTVVKQLELLANARR